MSLRGCLRRLLLVAALLPLAACVSSHLSGRTVDAGMATVESLLVVYEPKSFRSNTFNGSLAASSAAHTLAELVPHLQARLPVILGAQGIPTRMVSDSSPVQPEPGEKVLRLSADWVLSGPGGHTLALRAVLEDPARGATMWVGRLLLGNNGMGRFDNEAADRIGEQLLDQLHRQSLLARRAEPAPVPAAAPAAVAVPVVRPSRFAQLDDVDAIPYLNDRGRQVYRDWLALATPKAFAIAPNGSFFSTSGQRRDATLPVDATERALVACERLAKVPCKLYAVNGSVVWVR